MPLLAAACPDFASMIGFDDVVRGGAPASSTIPLSPPADGPQGALELGPVRYPLNVPEEPPPVAHRTHARRSTHDADAQRAAAATFNPAGLTEEFVVQTPVPLSWFLSRAASAGLSGAAVALVREFYHHCDPGGGGAGDHQPCPAHFGHRGFGFLGVPARLSLRTPSSLPFPRLRNPDCALSEGPGRHAGG